MSSDDNSFSKSGQKLALRWMEKSIRMPGKASDIRAEEGSDPLGGDSHRRAQRLHSQALRDLRLYRHLIDRRVSKTPPVPLLSILLLALAEISSTRASPPAPIVDSWTGLARDTGGKKSSGFVNAVLRRLVGDLQSILEERNSLPLGIRFSHPDWLVERWEAQWGINSCRRLLEWNQSIAPVFAAYESSDSDSSTLPLEPSQWKGFYRVESFGADLTTLLDKGFATIRDPATRIAVAATLTDNPTRVLDLCASPGGKSRGILSSPKPPRELVAADLPGRMEWLRKNLSPWRDRTILQAANLETGEGVAAHWKEAFDAVLLDTPCSNTGVLRRKPDAKWRLRPADIPNMQSLQLHLLEEASHFVSEDGTLVYSTCSLEAEENLEVIRKFLGSHSGSRFHLESAIHALPFKTGHDGAGVFRMKKNRK